MIDLRNLTLPLSNDYHPQKQQTLSFRLETGKHYWLVGPPESGKTSLLDILALRRRFLSGQLSMFGFDIDKKTASRTLSLLRARTGYIPDQPEFIENWTLFDNVALPLRLNQYDRRTILRDTTSILKWLSLDDEAQNVPARLSHTERIKLAVARALVTRPALLLIDKLAFSLNLSLRDKLILLLKDMVTTGKTTIVTATDKTDITTLLPAPLLTLPLLSGTTTPSAPSSTTDMEPLTPLAARR
ncbi:ATP-binding cassette domain-containing protein [Acetobacteraceae bacterium ESL0709]|nr:ATP-binding cassette domain-containing protein [Acetobacteraceae bacterium ESL0697]MDF7678562.1 ATP-binding cassette domain-containing protein [Acetobacteraceae bacterium ESL0709]